MIELDKAKKQYDIESKKLVNLTEQQIKYFLLKLKDGNIDDIKYRKTLITMFINKIIVKLGDNYKVYRIWISILLKNYETIEKWRLL